MALLGVADDTLTFDRTGQFWTDILGITNFNLFTGKLLAGYIEHGKIEDSPDLTVRQTADALLARLVAGAFERADGSWRFICRSLWKDQPLFNEVPDIKQPEISATYCNSRFDIIEASIEPELSQRAAYTGVEFTDYGAIRDDKTTNIRIGLERDSVREALYGERRLNQRGLFIYTSSVAGSFREINALLREPVPIILKFSVSGNYDDDLNPHGEAQLWGPQPGGRISVLLTGGKFSGTLMNRRVSESELSDQEHELTVWVHSVQTTEGLIQNEITWLGDFLGWGSDNLEWG